MMGSYRQFEHDLYWGQRLLFLSIQHGSEGFRGNAKGGGFQAYLKSEGIPRRRAYRLIRRYKLIQHIWDKVRVANAPLIREVIGPPPTQEQMEKLSAALEAMCDTDSDTNAVEAAK